MDSFLQRILEGIGGGECGEVREHDVFQVHGFENRTEDNGALFHLRGQEQEQAERNQPQVPEPSGKNKDRGKALANGDGTPRSRYPPDAAAEHSSQYAASIHGIGWQQIHCSEVKVDPDQATRQIGRLHKGPTQKMGLGGQSINGDGADQPEQQVNQRPGQSYANLLLPQRFRERSGSHRTGRYPRWAAE